MTSLIFVDSRVPQTETLLRHLPHGALVSRIGVQEDALTHIAARLFGAAGIDNLMLVSHGAPGALYLGATPLTADLLDTRTDALAAIGAALAPDGLISLYGCRVAAGVEGEIFLDRLEELTGRAVAATDTLVGHADLGGDWTLFRRDLGQPVLMPFAADLATDYRAVLVTHDFAGATVGGSSPVFTIADDGVAMVYTASNLGGFSTSFTTSDYIFIEELEQTGFTLTINRPDDSAFYVTSLKIGANDLSNPTVVLLDSNGDPIGGTLQNVSYVEGGRAYENFSTYTFSNAQAYGVRISTSSEGVELAVDDFIFQTSLNAAPTVTGTPGTITVTEDTAGTVDLSALSFADSDGDTLTVTLSVTSGSFSTPVDGSAVGAGVTETLVNAKTITLVGKAADINTYLDTASNINYTGGANIAGNNAATITVSASDGTNNLSSNPQVKINITAVNDAPTVSGEPATLTVTEDAESNVDLSSLTFEDVDDDHITVTLKVDAGSFSTLADGADSSVTETLLPDSKTITLYGTAGDINSYLDNASNIKYTGATNASGNEAATLTISATDGTLGLAADKQVKINITAVNDAPVLDNSKSPSFGTVAEDLPAPTNGSTANSVTVSSLLTGAVTDADSGAVAGIAVIGVSTQGTLYYSIDSGATWASAGTPGNSDSLLLNGDALLYFRPNENVEGEITDVLTFRAWDQTSGSNGATASTAVVSGPTAFSFNVEYVAISITGENDAPTVTSGATASFAENGTGTAYTVTGSDPDTGDTLTFAISGGADAALFDIDSKTGAITFKTVPDFENPADDGGNNVYDIEVTASDGTLTSPAKAVAITVTDANEPALVDLNGGDAGTGASAEFTENGNALTLVPNASISDLDSTNLLKLDISLTNAQVDSLEGVSLDGYSNGDVANGITITYTDSATISLSGSGSLASYTALLKALQYTNTSDAPVPETVRTVTVTATDDQNITSTAQTISVTVKAVNDAPSVNDKLTTATVAENGTGTVYTVTGSDPDTGDTLTFAISGGADAALFNIDGKTGAITFKTAPDFENPSDDGKNNVYDIKVTASDGTLTSSAQDVTITVTDANDAPTLAANKGASVETGQTVKITTAMLNEGDQDDDGADLTYTLEFDPEGGDLLLSGVTLAEGDHFTQQDIDDGKLTFKAGTTAGSFGFDFELTDDDDASLNGQEFTITVTTPAPDTPATPPIVVTPTTPTTPGTGGTGNQAETITNNGSTPGSAAIVQNTNNNGNVVTATLPGNTTIRSEGPTQAQTKTDALTSLVTSIQVRGSTSETQLVGGAQTYLTNLAQTTTLDVRTIIPTTTASSLSSPIIITGTSAAEGSTQSEAFVIDLRSLPSGTNLQLDNIEFASIMGSATITGGAGQNYVVADENSQYIMLGEDDDYIDGGAGDDTVGSAGGNDTLLGGAGNDSVFGGLGDDSLDGGTGFDTLDLAGGGANWALGGMNGDTVMGGAGNDELRGGKGHDSITGGAGDDVLYSGFGNDTLTGGDGADVFILRAYDAAFADAILTATVTDFQQGTDHLAVENATLAELQAAIASQTVTETGVVIEVGGATLTFLGITQLTTADIDQAFYA
ncbi:DUF4347 domain-containing protein [Oceanibaculum indicum]|uniref:Hemolysin type calcium-binding protein n=1 Tax=Oceanibaculum indicum TaxID=526216 RepID=A0A420WBC5_9PROT|nr:DUF4347 domain-containing protein [Oceanibaculum indicum]RKQ68232.1 hemolysin type calcium-binding protein [Oceanibaculum indicum]